MSKVSGALAIAAAVIVGPLSAHALTLKEAVEYAITTNPSVGVARAERRATRYELQQAKGRLLPRVDLELDTGKQKTSSEVEELTEGNNEWLARRQVQVNASQILFDGWDRFYDIYKNAARLDAAALNVLDRTQAIGLDAIEAYIDYRRQSSVLGVARRNVIRHSEILGLVRAQFEGGKVPLSDVNQIRSRLAAADAVVAVTRRQLLDAEADFHRIIGLEPAGTQPVPWPALVPASEEDAIIAASTNHPGIRSAVANADAARNAEIQSQAAFFPEISLEGAARHGEDVNGNPGYDNEYVGKLVLRWNVFDGLIKHNRHREMVERVAIARLETDVRRRGVVESVEKAWSALVTGRERVDALRSQVEASEKVVSAFLEEYELSRRTLLEVLDAESLLFNARVQLIGAESIRLFSAYQLLTSTGLLLESLGVAPPKEAVADAQAREHEHINAFDVFLEPLRGE